MSENLNVQRYGMDLGVAGQTPYGQ